LCGDTPRQSDLIIKDGKRWKIDWAEERLIPQKKKAPRLPKYGEITGRLSESTGQQLG
jgi:hypothetical protein